MNQQRVTPTHNTIQTSFPLTLAKGILQRKCACGQHKNSGEKCTACSKKILNLPLQTKLQMGQVNDRYELEADRVAEHVMRIPKPDNVDTKDYLQAPPFIQRRISNTQIDTAEAPPIVYDVLSAAGQTLDHETRHYFETRFDHDFSQVRIHNDSKARSSANAVSAKAYTVGQNVVFGTGHYAPSTNAGKHLLAHELTHVVQQSGNSGAAGVIQRVGECNGRNGFNCNGVRCTTPAGRRGLCTWGGVTFGCNCRDTSTDAPRPSNARELLPSWLIFLIGAAAVAAVVACFATGVCEFAAVVAGLGAAAAAAVIAILNAAGIRDSGGEGGGGVA